MELQNDLLLQTAKGIKGERPPVWMMRQAGRILPEYRAIRSRLSGFKELVQRPDLAAEVTLQPVDALGVDAAILFSDILVIPECMGLDYELVEKKGPFFPKTILNKQDILDLREGEEAAEHLAYVYEAIHLCQAQLAGRVPLIGFAGAPWTLLAYMLEGQGSKTFSKAKRFLYQEPVLAHQLIDKITSTVIAYLRLKIQAGVQIVQIFDSWAGLLTPGLFREFALPAIRKITEAIDEVPVIVFAKGAHFALQEISQLDAEVIGVDWTLEPQLARSIIGPDKCVQGNLDPCNLYAPPAAIQEAATSMIRAFGGPHIVNLGHGVYPDTPLDNVKAFVDTVKSFRYD
jgi:uroporphyrinogen decarboxylase